LDENNLVSPTTISSGATSASTFYSASAVSASSPYKVCGLVDNTQATAGTYVTQPSLVRGATPGLAGMLSSLGYGSAHTDVTATYPTAGTTYYNTTGRPFDLYLEVQGSGSQPWSCSITTGGVTYNSPGENSNWIGTVRATIKPGAGFSWNCVVSVAARKMLQVG
jgi:hypothetical protein